MIEVIVWVLLVKGNNIFLLKNKTSSGDEWTLVGGHVEADESIGEKAAALIGSFSIRAINLLAILSGSESIIFFV